MDIKKKQTAGQRMIASAKEALAFAQGLRLFEEHEELRATQIKNLRQQIQEGRESSTGIPADKVFNRLEEKYSKLTSET